MSARKITFARAKSIVTKATAIQIGDALFSYGIDDGYVDVYQNGYPDPLISFCEHDLFYIEGDGTLTISLDSGGIYNLTILQKKNLRLTR